MNIFKPFLWLADVFAATFFLLLFFLISIPQIFLSVRIREPSERLSLLYIGYTTFDQAVEKGLLHNAQSAKLTYDPGGQLAHVTVLIPFGKRQHITDLAENIKFLEIAPSQNFLSVSLTTKVWRLIWGCVEAKKQALLHDVVMVGGPNLASIAGVYVKIMTGRRCILFIEAFWEQILALQVYMSSIQRLFWFYWYAVLYRIFDAYIGAPSYKPEFYIGRGMSKNKIWPYIHPVNFNYAERERLASVLSDAISCAPRPWIITIGRLEKEKFCFDAVDIAQELAHQGASFTLIMIGDGAERQTLMKEVDSRGLGDYVLFTGALSNDQVFSLACEAEICFAAYMGSALVEAFLAGCAVVAYDNDAHRAIGGDSPSKFIQHGAIKNAASAIYALISSPDKLLLQRNETRKYALKKWSKENIINAYMAPILKKRSI